MLNLQFLRKKNLKLQLLASPALPKERNRNFRFLWKSTFYPFLKFETSKSYQTFFFLKMLILPSTLHKFPAHISKNKKVISKYILGNKNCQFGAFFEEIFQKSKNNAFKAHFLFRKDLNQFF